MVITVTKRCSMVATAARDAQWVSAAKFSGGTFSRQCLGSTGHWENTVRALVPAKHRSQSTADLTPSAEGAGLAAHGGGRAHRVPRGRPHGQGAAGAVHAGEPGRGQIQAVMARFRTRAEREKPPDPPRGGSGGFGLEWRQSIREHTSSV